MIEEPSRTRDSAQEWHLGDRLQCSHPRYTQLVRLAMRHTHTGQTSRTGELACWPTLGRRSGRSTLPTRVAERRYLRVPAMFRSVAWCNDITNYAALCAAMEKAASRAANRLLHVQNETGEARILIRRSLRRLPAEHPLQDPAARSRVPKPSRCNYRRRSRCRASCAIYIRTRR